jgi:hypothetical protein
VKRLPAENAIRWLPRTDRYCRCLFSRHSRMLRHLSNSVQSRKRPGPGCDAHRRPPCPRPDAGAGT